jgi:heme/copper-type cytochrome/quinol oxidase subunit 2
MKNRLWIATVLALSIAAAGCHRGRKEARVVPVQMKKYAVIPGEIHAQQGEVVWLEVTTADVQHGFDVPDLGIKESVQPGKTARFTLPTDRKGRFEVVCGVICGARHDEMRGVIVVE